MQANSTSYTVADYLIQRLSELKLRHLFGVAGNYTAPLLDTMLADPAQRIAMVNMPNELVAGYAADAYARVNGFAAVAVTYSVGAFHALNPFAGAFVEQIPMLLINGSLTNKEWINETQVGLIYSHSLSDPMSNLNVFRQATIAAERICNGIEAPYQIDAVLSACISRSGPVYLEVLEDIWRAPCAPPREPLQIGQSYITNTSDQSSLAQALTATQAMLEQFPEPTALPFFWVGAEIARQGLQAELEDVLAYTQVNYTTSVMGKGVISEDNPLFKGVFTPPNANNDAGFYNANGEFLGNCMIGLGAWLTSKDVAFHNITSERTALAAHTGVRVGAEFFPLVQLRDYLAGMKTVIDNVRRKLGTLAPQHRMLAALPGETSMTYNNFFATLAPWLKADHVLTVDAGFPLIGASNLPVHSAGSFICQASWLSIGYSVGAAVGAKCAEADKRVLVIVGDGAFQQTCQAVAAQAALKHNTVVFVINNGIYGIEQNLVNPNPFRNAEQKVNYPDPMYNQVYAYNLLYNWHYDKITECMGGIGRVVDTIAQLQAVLAEIEAHPHSNFVVTINVPQTDSPGTISSKSAASNPGEDEIPNPAWPPEDVF